MRLDDLARRIGAEVRGDAAHVVRRCAALDAADAQAVTFIAKQKYARLLKKSRAGAVIIGADNVGRAPEGMALLIADDPYYAFQQAVVALHGFRVQPPPGVSPLAVVEAGAELGVDCAVEPFAVIRRGAKLGDRCVIHPHCVVGPDVTLGADSVLYPGVVIYEECVLGARVILHAGCVVGTDGFGFATHRGAHHKIPQVGRVEIGDDVELGANTVVQRGTASPTVIAAGTKMSDLVNIGHGSRIGRGNLIVSQVGIAGSVTTGDYVVMGGQVGVAGHLTIGDQAQIAAKSGIVSDVPAKTQYGGSPAIPLSEAKRVGMEVIRLPQLVARLRELEKRVARLDPDA
jgi:UDP-3-O-[3-hydroxymyristoyl] glucosamine N-acyltransferase